MFKFFVIFLCAVSVAKLGQKVQAKDDMSDLNDEEKRLIQKEEELIEQSLEEEQGDQDMSKPIIFMSQRKWLRIESQRTPNRRIQSQGNTTPNVPTKLPSTNTRILTARARRSPFRSMFRHRRTL